MSFAAALAACGSSRDAGLASVAATPAANGPQADYPITVGAPYTVDGITYTPVDVFNYDEVGYLTAETGTMGYTGAHHTLPVPSYAEVTSLESGRTVLVRLERRGPMDSTHLVALSPAAMAQLGATAETPVRLRRVNPPEEQRAMLRSGNAAPLRMDTPMSLVSVLRRRLPASGSASLSADAAIPQPIETVEVAASTATPAPAAELPSADGPAEYVAAVEVLVPAPVELETSVAEAPVETATVAEAAVEPAPEVAEAEVEAEAQPAADGRFMVQAATFSTIERARSAANVLGGEVSQAGRYFRVRTGPFATRGEAEASLANVHRAGYTDARILTSG
ncbi:SPOR domain-containing protein [Aurantiacibacter sp. MUD11]|uniref:SPOR domain-containing protein n=1 Tax=Aurantiacibacter sp. MUD11 TaxID=3003265 RepID=UPI0022AADC63|nr:SPOR domain-containing protein [Aurantiacibacter sp. MUD11]WAT18342.1 SPOR domain-containing protein [Aurantiacibacter sp. MUD11]